MDLVGYRTTDGRFVSNFRVVGRSFRKVLGQPPGAANQSLLLVKFPVKRVLIS